MEDKESIMSEPSSTDVEIIDTGDANTPVQQEALDLPRALNGYSRPDVERLVAELKDRERRLRARIADQTANVRQVERERDTCRDRATRAENDKRQTEQLLAQLRHDYGALEEKLATVEKERDEARRMRDRPLETWGESLQQVADEAQEYARNTKDEADKQAQQIIADANGQAARAVDEANAKAQSIIDEANGQSERVKREASDAYEQTRVQAQQLIDEANSKSQSILAEAEKRRDAALGVENDTLERIRAIRSTLLDAAHRLDEANTTNAA